MKVVVPGKSRKVFGGSLKLFHEVIGGVDSPFMGSSTEALKVVLDIGCGKHCVSLT